MSEGKHAELNGNGIPTQLTTVTLTAEQFEALYLQPRATAPKSSLAGNLGNPTAIGVTSFLLCLFPVSMEFMEFQGATSSSSITSLGGFYGVGGIGLYLASIMEWIIGNTFPSVVFALFGGFWISYAIILQPSFEIAASFATPDQATSNAAATAAGSANVAYNHGLAFYFLTWGIVCLILFVASLRTNVPFAGIFLFITIAFELVAAAYFHIGSGNVSQGTKEIKAAGACCFVVSLFGFWVDISLLFAAVGLPPIPLIDLSGYGKKQTAASQV